MRAGTVVTWVSCVAALGAACARAPEGVQRLRSGEQYHATHFPKARKVLFVDGKYPRKSKLGVVDLESGETRAFYLPGYRLTPVWAVDKKERAVVGAAVADDSGDSHLLLVSLADGSVQGRVADTTGWRWIAMSRPSWTSRAFWVRETDGAAYLGAYDFVSERLEDPVAIGKPVVRAAFADKIPVVLLETPDELLAFDLLAHRIASATPLGERPTCLEPSADGAVLCRAVPGTSQTKLELVHANTGTARPLGTVEGPAESLLDTESKVYVVTKDLRAPPGSDRRFFPRTLTILSKEGSPAVTVPWTKRGESLFGRDDPSQRLLFAATEPMSLWALADRREALPAAIAELDRTAGELWTSEAKWLGFAGLCIVGFFWIVKATRPGCQSCGD
ncbi:MAG: hypothetical protein HY553_11720 [Elusimicrobia bacterium]|nr:hypothetical protein [Elusimicrobiota bacterium]